MRTRLLAPLVLLLTGALLSPSPAAARPERPAPAPVAAGQPAAAPDWTPPLSTRGRYVVDAEGRRFKLRSGNWHGSSGTWNGSGPEDDPANNHAGEVGRRAPLGLDRKPMGEIVADFRELGLNSVRLPFSNQMLDDTRPVSGLAANPEP